MCQMLCITINFFKELPNRIDFMNIDVNRNIILVGDWNPIQECEIEKKGGNEHVINTVV